MTANTIVTTRYNTSKKTPTVVGVHGRIPD